MPSITVRDRRIRACIARLPWMTAAQVAARFDMTPSRAYARLRALRAAGLLNYSRIWDGGPGVYYVGRPPSPYRWEHDRQQAELLVSWETRGLVVVTDLEMQRAEAATGERRWSVELAPDATGRSRAHRPDFVIEAHQLAVEIELSAKSNARLAAILAAYARSGRYVAVRYLVPDQAAVKRITAAANANGAGQLVTCQLLNTTGELV